MSVPGPPNPRGFGINPGYARLGHWNVLLTAPIRRRYQASYVTPLTLKAVLRGVAHYRTPRGHYAVDPETVLLLNQGQHYELDISAESGTETFAIFFEPRFVVEAIHAARSDDEALLDNPVSGGEGELRWDECFHSIDSSAGRVIREMGRRYRRGAPAESWLEDAFHDLAACLPRLAGDGARRSAKLPSSRVSTRREIYRRLLLARDYAYSNPAGDLSVEALARHAAMSPFHFHRNFRRAFGATPAGFVRERRLQRAVQRLAAGQETVADTAAAVGFASAGSFNNLFRRRFGISPGALQRMTAGELRKFREPLPGL